MRIASLSLLLTILCLMLAVTPAKADPLLYENGHWNGTIDAWTINFGFSVSDSFVTAHAGDITDFHFVYADLSTTDLLTSVDMAFGTSSFGGVPQTFSPASNTFLGPANYPGQPGYNLYLASFTLSIPWGGGLGFVTLSNACTNSGCSTNPIYWDQNNGVGCLGDDGHGGGCPSTAYENTLGSILSEAFTLTGPGGYSVPESSDLAMLLGFGIFNLAAVFGFRRKLI